MHDEGTSSHEEKFVSLCFQISTGENKLSCILGSFCHVYLFQVVPIEVQSLINLPYFIHKKGTLKVDFCHFFMQLIFIASITMTVFLRTQMAIDVFHANYYMGSLFYALVILFFEGIPELSMTVSRLAAFYKQSELYFYPAWAYAIPASILKLPLSLLESVVWTSLTYYVIGYSPEVGR